MVNSSIAQPTIAPEINSPIWVQPAERPELVYSPDPLALAEQAELLARYYSLMAEAFRIEANLKGAE